MNLCDACGQIKECRCDTVEIDVLRQRMEVLEKTHEEAQVQMDRLHQELQERPNWKDVTWDYANDLVIRIKIAVKDALYGPYPRTIETFEKRVWEELCHCSVRSAPHPPRQI